MESLSAPVFTGTTDWAICIDSSAARSRVACAAAGTASFTMYNNWSNASSPSDTSIFIGGISTTTTTTTTTAISLLPLLSFYEHLHLLLSGRHQLPSLL